MNVAIILSPVNVPKFEVFCIRCRRYVGAINRDILTIAMGVEYPDMDIPRNMGWMKNQCHACKTEYNFYFN